MNRKMSWHSAKCALIMVLFLTIALGGHPARSADIDFETWVQELRTEALTRGISENTIKAALTGLSPIARIIELDRKQPEFTQTLEQYLARTVSDARIERGRQLMREHHKLLTAVSKKFGVQPRFIVALWGMESDFGRFTGGFHVITALATLAYDGRRSNYFRTELFHALKIVDDGHIAANAMLGSWAGAMGQNQFMPSSFVRYAVDYDGDGRRDIWRTHADIFASTANYLRQVGWLYDQTWGREVALPAAFNLEQANFEVKRPLNEWQSLGIRRADGGELPKRDLAASLVLPAKTAKPAFLVHDNYRAIMKWNRAHFFAIAVGKLADGIGEE